MIQIRINENGMPLRDCGSLYEAKIILQRFIEEDNCCGESVEEGFYEIYDTETGIQLETNNSSII